MNDEFMDVGDKNAEATALPQVPDATYLIKKANESILSYMVQSNDLRYMQYHRNNGITKMIVIDGHTGLPKTVRLTVEGQISSADLLH